MCSTTTSLMSMPYPMVFNYSASKAALHSFILCMREQLKQKPECRIKVTELVTPLVQSKFPLPKSPLVRPVTPTYILTPQLNCTTASPVGAVTSTPACL
jgi:short-subunit dehydrogenase involved in D-alanine esterification of teichoic acids